MVIYFLTNIHFYLYDKSCPVILCKHKCGYNLKKNFGIKGSTKSTKRKNKFYRDFIKFRTKVRKGLQNNDEI